MDKYIGYTNAYITIYTTIYTVGMYIHTLNIVFVSERLTSEAKK